MADKLTTPLDEFKERELEIINLMAEGLSNQEIADQLFVTKETVRWYNKQIYSKLGTSRRTEAIALARDMRLIVDAQANTPFTHVAPVKLPVTTGPFIGRDNDLAELTNLLNNPDMRLISIIAPGGMGKSRLSLELGHLIKGNYDGVAFIDLTSVRNPDDVAKFAVASLGLSANSEVTPQEALFNYCREKALLLIFDNFEDVLPARNLLSDILEVAPKVTIIVTSREQLNLRVETTYYLQPILDDGISLFIELATVMSPNIEIHDDEKVAIQQIVELVGGLPLGLILAATWVDTLSIPEIVEEIKVNLDFLSTDMGDMPERQRSIHAVVDPTWKRLSEQEQHAFMRASVFRGGFTRETFQVVTGASIRTVQTLLRRSLISHGHGRRYDMHPLLRQYAREKLEKSGTLIDAKQAHLKTFLEYAQTQADRMYDGQHYLESLEMLDLEQDNFRSALDWSFTGYDTQSGISLILTLYDFWTIRSQHMEGLYYFEQALKHKQEVALYPRLGSMQARLGKPDSADENLQKAITLATEANRQDVLARAYRLLDTYSEETYSLLQQALTINQELNLSREIAHCYVHLGLYFYDIEFEPLEALDHFEQAKTIYEELGDLQGVSMAIYNIGLVYHRDGHSQRAREYYEQSLTIKQQIGDRAGVARRLTVLAGMDIMDEEFEQAIAYIDESRLICEEIGELNRLVEVLSGEGLLHLIMTAYHQAQAVLEQGLEIALSIKRYAYIVRLNSYIGLLFLLQKQVQKAKPYIVNALLIDITTIHPPWASIITYANFLWYDNDFDSCLPITAILFRHMNDINEPLVNKYFLEPLIYRVRQHIDDDAWQETLHLTKEVTIEQLLQDVVNEIKAS